jgi:glycerol-3-phosphate acyltransferase PlsY
MILLIILVAIMAFYFAFEDRDFMKNSVNSEMLFLIVEVSLLICLALGRYVNLYLRPLSMVGILTLFLDALKGLIPALVGYFVFRGQFATKSGFEFSDLAKYSFGLCAVLGHIYPVIYKFKGGKGIATTIGALLACSITSGVAWMTIAIMAMVAAVFFLYFAEVGAMASFIAITPPAIGNGVYLFIKYKGFLGSIANNVYYVITCLIILAICLFTYFAHRKNIERMLAGEEHPTSIKEMVGKLKAKKLKAKEEQK